MIKKMPHDEESNLMRAIVLKQILQNRGLSYENLAELVRKHYPNDKTINEDAIKERMHTKLGEEWCKKIEIALELPKDTLTNIK